MSWLTDAFIVALAVGGVLAYRGVWTSWASRPLGDGAGFMLPYLAIAAGAIRVAEVVLSFGSAKWVLAIFLFAAIASALLSVLSLFWLPKFLTPKWFNAVRGR